MFYFLRRIRKYLIASNNFHKYILYAIGEIILVVTGILIAFQVNSWNEKRKALVLEIQLLNQFETELNADIVDINEVINYYEKVNASCQVLIQSLKTRQTYHDSLGYHFDMWNDYEHFNINTSAISNLNSRGVEIITNDSLRNQILHLYNQTYAYATEIGEYFRQDHVHGTYPVHLQRIEPIVWREQAIPNDYESLFEDKVFMNHLQWIKNASYWNLQHFYHTLDEVEKVIRLIQDQLRRYD